MNVLLTLVVVAVLVGLVVAMSHQGIVAALRPVDAAWAELLAQLTRRHEAAAVLAAALAAHGEEEVQAGAALTAACATAAATDDVAARATAENEVSRHLDVVEALAARPGGEHDPTFERLRERPRMLEHDVQVARALYDAHAQTYTTRCSLYPGRYVAAWFGFPSRPAFALRERGPASPPPRRLGA